jgi:thioredoxin-related protein
MAISAEDAAWLLNAQTDLNKAFTQAKKEKTPMIVLLVVKDGCSWCEKMVNETMQDNTIKNALADAVIVVTDFHSEAAKTYETVLTPTVYFIDAKTGKSIGTQVGYEKAGNFLITVISAFDTVDQDR